MHPKIEEQYAAAKDTHLQQCGNNCCNIAMTTAMLLKLQEKAKEMIPLKAISINGHIYESFTRVDVQLEYFNPSSKNTVETVFEYPLDDKMFVKEISIRRSKKQKFVSTMVIEKEKAEQQYDDDIAKGKLVVMGRSEKDKKKMSLKVGNILPLQSVTVKLITI